MVQRRSVHTRIADPADVPAVAALWNELRRLGARAERAVNPLTVADATQRFSEVVSQLDADVIVACDGPDLAGLAVVRVVQPDPLSPTRLLQMSNVVVASGHRRRGIGHALVAAAADYADSHGVDHVAAGVYPSLRDANRFFARLGFAPVTVERVAPVTGLQRRLTAGTMPIRVGEQVRRRRLQRPLVMQRRSSSAAESRRQVGSID